MEKIINVTEPYLPPIEEYIIYLQKIWNSKVLTNAGPLHQQLEIELSEYLGVPYVSLFTNATIALVAAIKVLDLSGEIITTPYSFVATSNAILLNGIKPIFVDIDPNTFNIDPQKIDKAITAQTTAILPVHCYGHPCDVEKIQKIAEYNNLKVIYDAAHAFGVKCHCGSILNHGNLSVLSFHATKVFNTFEGGAIISHDLNTKNKIDQLRNFGFENETSVVQLGLNGKMSEINAAMGLLQLKYIDSIIEKRKLIDLEYRKNLEYVVGIKLIENKNIINHNYSYFPIIINEDYHLSRDELYFKLKSLGINCRRYFYPLISEFLQYKEFKTASNFNVPNAQSIASKVLCLPIYPNLDLEKVKTISFLISEQ
jgi:dTDP-4-amino-4,6-dideoxygalactose transaminase